MKTKYEIGEIVYVPAEIISAHIQKDRRVYYRVRMQLMDGIATDDVYETQIAGDLVLGTIDDENTFTPVPRWDPAAVVNNKEPKEETNATT